MSRNRLPILKAVTACALLAPAAMWAGRLDAADVTYTLASTDDLQIVGGAPSVVASGQVKIGGGQLVVASQVGVGGLPFTGTRLNIAASSAANNFLAFSDSAAGGQNWLVGPGVGSGSPAAFSLYNASNSSTLMTVTTNGFLGVGTVAPLRSLHVKSASNAGVSLDIVTANAATGAANIELRNSNATVGNATGIEFLNANTAPSAFISGVNYNHAVNGTQSGGLDFSVFNAGSVAHAMTITPNGNVGIGTATPGSLLTVNGVAPGSAGALRVSRIDIAGGQPAASGSIDPNQFASLGNPAVAFRMGLYQNGDTWMFTSFASDYSQLLNTVINPTGGSLGVGIQPTNARGALQVAFHGAAGAAPVSSGSTDPNQFCTLGNMNVTLRMGDYFNGDIWLQPSLINDYATDHNLVLNPNNGNVVIGTGTGPVTNKLTVYGAISAKEVKVTTSGADYVFADGYRLRPLSEVEAFVTRERHLPGVMAAKEMVESGLPVSQVVTVQLAKIEELTLYAIAAERDRQRLEERASALDKRRAALEASLASLSARLERLEAAAPQH